MIKPNAVIWVGPPTSLAAWRAETKMIYFVEINIKSDGWRAELHQRHGHNGWCWSTMDRATHAFENFVSGVRTLHEQDDQA